MPKALLAVGTSERLPNLHHLVLTAKQHVPVFQPIIYLLDGEQEYEENGCKFYPAKDLFSQNYQEVAFSYPALVLEEVVTLRALHRHRQEYSAILVCDWGTVFQADIPALELTYPNDVAVYFVDSKATTKQKRDTLFLLNTKPNIVSPVWLLNMGEHAFSFLEAGCNKLDYLYSIGIRCTVPIGFENIDLISAPPLGLENIKFVNEQPIGAERTGVIGDQAGYFTTWNNYPSSFGCKEEFISVENLSMYYTKPVCELPVLSYKRILVAQERLAKEANAIVKFGGQHKVLEGFVSEQEYVFDELLKRYSQSSVESIEEYTSALDKYPEVKSYSYATFEDGTPVLDMLRAYYAYDYRLAERCNNNPFACSDLFLQKNVLTGDENLLLYNAAMAAIWHWREDLQGLYPAPAAEARLAYLHWYLQNAAVEWCLPDEYITPVQKTLEEYKQRLAQQAAQRSLATKIKDKVVRIFTGQPAEKYIEMFATPHLKEGVNLCGYIRGDFGVAEACRILARSLDAASIPFTIVDFKPQVDYEHTFTNHSWDHKISNEFRYNTNILLTNAPGTKSFVNSVAPSALANRYNIGYWYWELPEFPTAWSPNFELLDEVWTSSEFTANSIRSATDKPVFVVPCCVEVDLIDKGSKIDVGLRENAFVFLMMYDAMSSQKRKNPEGVIDAFLSEFTGDMSVQLAIKVSAPETWSFDDTIMNKVKHHDNIVVLKGTYPRSKVNALLSCCDAFVSLHRSEGFGLGPAEAMYLGKPVILTNWSGNTQYMRMDNCCPVDCTVIEIDEPFGEYKRGRHWADPDIKQAAKYMRRLVDEKEYYSSIAAAGQKTILEEFDALTTGKYAEKRLVELGQIKGSTMLEN